MLVVLVGGLALVLHPGLLNLEKAEEGAPLTAQLQDFPDANVPNSPYFAKVDIYNMTSKGDRLVLPYFKTRQQRAFYTCAPVAAMMVVDYYLGECKEDELEVAKIMGTSSNRGTTIGGVVKYFEHLGWDVVSSGSKSAPGSYTEFIKWIKQNLQRKTPVIVENVDWGGHYRVIIGYDGMGTETASDDVLFLADSFDTSDHWRDGYNVTSAERFYYMWFDHKLFGKNEQDRLYVIAKPK